jgi:hypothetical protein
MGLTMSAAQLENLVRNNVDRLEDDRELNEWLPGVATDVSSVDVGLWRCPSGEIACDEGCCGDCDFCDNAGLWESPFDWDRVHKLPALVTSSSVPTHEQREAPLLFSAEARPSVVPRDVDIRPNVLGLLQDR